MTNSKNPKSLDLESAQSLIIQSCTVLESEKVDVSQAVGRIAAQSHKALEPLPGYDGSLRDGYAVGGVEEAGDAKKDVSFKVIDEVAAGDTRKLRVGRGEAIRIMTGGLVPVGCEAVIAQENCKDEGEKVFIPHEFLNSVNNYIHTRGSEIAKGEVILPKGHAVSIEQQILLAGGGYQTLDLVRKPKINFFCTGSELLTNVGEVKKDGQRFSTNNHLLSGLIPCYGALLGEQATVADDTEQVVSLIDRMVGSGCDILISTGGVGPGKFDLIEEAFARCGGRTIYRSLNMRPGKSTLFGTLGNTLFFGLPGSPPAVQMLFHELVRPAIGALQGTKECRLQTIKAIMSEDMLLSARGLARLKSGVQYFKDASCMVRPAKKNESSNSYIVCPASAQVFAHGDKVTIHLI